MIVLNYFCHQLLSRTFRYCAVLTILISLIESIELGMLIPVPISLIQNIAMWLSSWPLLACWLLPACFYAAYLVTAVRFSSTQELAIMYCYVSPSAWRKRMLFFSVLLSCLLFVALGWLIPWGQSTKSAFSKSLISAIKLPKLLPGQFNHLDVGGKKIVVYNNKSKGKRLFVATQMQGEGVQTLISTQKIQLQKNQGVPTLTFAEGSSYTFDAEDRLKQAVRFKDSQVPLRFDANLSQKDHVFQMTSDQLFRSDWLEAKSELAWRTNFSVSIVIMTVVALLLIDYLTCRRAASRIYIIGGLLAVAYYFALLVVKYRSQHYFEGMLYSAYIASHLGVVLLCFLLVRFTSLLRIR